MAELAFVIALYSADHKICAKGEAQYILHIGWVFQEQQQKKKSFRNDNKNKFNRNTCLDVFRFHYLVYYRSMLSTRPLARAVCCILYRQSQQTYDARVDIKTKSLSYQTYDAPERNIYFSKLSTLVL